MRSRPPLLSALQQKDRLRSPHVHANLALAQAARLACLLHLREITLDFPSESLMNALPRWAALLQNNLPSLTLYVRAVSFSLVSIHLLRAYMAHDLPVDHLTILSFVSHAPHLESLSMTSVTLSPPPFLRPLALDALLLPGPAPTATAISNHPSAPSLSSLIFEFSGTGAGAARRDSSLYTVPASRRPIPLVDCAPGTTAKLLAGVRGWSAWRLECARAIWCVRLPSSLLPPLPSVFFTIEGTQLTHPQTLFGAAFARSTTLRSLVNLAPHTHTYAVCPALMARVPRLCTVVSAGRVLAMRPGLFLFRSLFLPSGFRHFLSSAVRALLVQSCFGFRPVWRFRVSLRSFSPGGADPPVLLFAFNRVQCRTGTAARPDKAGVSLDWRGAAHWCVLRN
ncbi:hypothetical protein FB451DRAFT_1413100 [Mycena latifolia]|nr:hypothetical protein FB451DRAFT_1413100 [Mycena latifolia]